MMLLELGLDLILLGAIFSCAYGLGKKILAIFSHGLFNDPNPETIAATGLGLAVIATLTFAVGLAGGLYSWIFYGSLVLLCALHCREIIELFRLCLQFPVNLLRSRATRMDLVLLALVGIALVSNLLFNYAPPTQNREMHYDLTMPKIYLQNHRIIDIPDDKVFYYPFLIHMLYLYALCLKRVLLAKLIHYALGCLCLGAVYFYARDLFGRRAAFYAGALFYLMPIVASLSGTANIEFGTLLYGLLAVWTLHLWIRSEDVRFFYCGAFFAGATLCTKITGIALTASFFLVALGLCIFHFKYTIGKILRTAILGTLLALAALSPWLIRNMIYSSNPVMPFGVSAFGWKGHETTDSEISNLKGLYSKLSAKKIAEGYHNILFGDFIYGGGPLMFAFLLPLFFTPHLRKACRLPLVVALLNYFILFNILPYPHCFYENRYYLVSFGLAAVLIGGGMAQFLRVWNYRWIRIAIVSALMFPSLTFSLLFAAKRVPFFLGLESRESYLKSCLADYHIVLFANENFGANSRVLLIGGNDVYPFYWQSRVVLATTKFYKAQGAGPVLKLLKNEGITHVLYYKNLYTLDSGGVLRHKVEKYNDLYWDLNAWTKGLLQNVYEDKKFVIFKI